MYDKEAQNHKTEDEQGQRQTDFGVNTFKWITKSCMYHCTNTML